MEDDLKKKKIEQPQFILKIKDNIISLTLEDNFNKKNGRRPPKNKWKTTSKKQMDLQKMKIKDNLNFLTLEDDRNFLKMEDNLIFI
jgi:hypothetical protein